MPETDEHHLICDITGFIRVLLKLNGIKRKTIPLVLLKHGSPFMVNASSGVNAVA
ncbi:MAG: hypothetical protein GX654_10910 [Desulfatiglans sp.]|jgi:hypothetical protein|nr:hypothetical protein [Desulfatiglans sp.]